MLNVSEQNIINTMATQTSSWQKGRGDRVARGLGAHWGRVWGGTEKIFANFQVKMQRLNLRIFIICGKKPGTGGLNDWKCKTHGRLEI